MEIINFKTVFAKKNGLFIAGLVGIALIFLSDVLFTNKNPTEKSKSAATNSTVQTEYAQDLEKRLTGLLAHVEGAGKVQVMITLETSGESVYAQNEQTTADTQTTTEGEQRKSSFQNEHIILDTQDAGDSPLIETQLAPEVKGAAILCQGAADITVVKRITDLASVVLGLPTNRICVSKMI